MLEANVMLEANENVMLVMLEANENLPKSIRTTGRLTFRTLQKNSLLIHSEGGFPAIQIDSVFSKDRIVLQVLKVTYQWYDLLVHAD